MYCTVVRERESERARALHVLSEVGSCMRNECLQALGVMGGLLWLLCRALVLTAVERKYLSASALSNK